MAIKATVALTYEDLADFPDDEYRRELVHGQLIVTPSPVGRHQRIASRLVILLGATCPPELEVLTGPYDWKLRADTVFVPDLMVFRKEDFDLDGPFIGTPLLVVEILSPSTRDTDTRIKRLEYERAGAGAYWIVDPGIPSLTVLRLNEDRYVEEAIAAGDEVYDADWPYRLSVTPSDLVR
ncbi:MAG: Uma2 family endonuclease [Acidimicrobiales bacterium]